MSIIDWNVLLTSESIGTLFPSIIPVVTGDPGLWLKCPIEATFHSCLVDDTERSQLIVTGFINQCWNDGMNWKKDNNLRYPSDDIIGLIRSFHCEQTIHLFSRFKNMEHWVINLVDLFN